MKLAQVNHQFFSVYFKGLQVTNFSINPLTHKMLASSGENVFLFDLLTENLLETKNFCLIVSEALPVFTHSKIELSCIRPNLYSSTWIVLINNKIFLLFNESLEYAPPVVVDFLVSEITMNPSSELVICLKEDKKHFKFFKTEISSEKHFPKGEASKGTLPNDKQDVFFSFEAALMPQKSPMSMKGQVTMSSLSDLDMLAAVIENREIVMLSCSRCEVLWSLASKGEQSGITAMTLYKEFLFYCDEKWLFIVDVVTRTEIKKSPLKENSQIVKIVPETLHSACQVVLITQNGFLLNHNFKNSESVAIGCLFEDPNQAQKPPKKSEVTFALEKHHSNFKKPNEPQKSALNSPMTHQLSGMFYSDTSGRRHFMMIFNKELKVLLYPFHSSFQ